MSKKHLMTENEYQIYKKQHPYDDVEDSEQGKIQCEKVIYIKKRRKVKNHYKQFLRSCVNSEDMEEDERYQETVDEDYIADRVRRNACTHKKRLSGLLLFETEKGSGAND